MALLLSIETSTNVCSVALHRESNLIAFQENRIPQTTASQLAVLVDKVFQEAGVKPASLQGVVVAAGPGSYTGLRIGVATAKGLCFALHIPLLSVNTLELLAYQVSANLNSYGNFNESEVLLCPMLDARRMEVYCMITNRQLQSIEPTQAKIVEPGSFHNFLVQPILFFGDGAAKCEGVINHPNAHFIRGILPSAAQLGVMGFQKYKRSEFEDLPTYEPFYLKDFVIKKPKSVS